ncbi:MAG: hypothetical protein LBM28_03965 [Oscillospiraceae bacterium]|nr:hypothetical protein [Oscillospiraceae bacterium]
MKGLLVALAVSLALTLALELGFYLLWYRRRFDKKDLLLLVAVNVLTNPPVVLLSYLALRYTGYEVLTAPLEVLAVLTEGYLYKKYARNIPRPYAFSLAVNAFSFGIGLLLQL